MDEHELTQGEVAAWTAGWDEAQQRIGPRFARAEERARGRRAVGGLARPGERPTGGELAERSREGRGGGRAGGGDRRDGTTVGAGDARRGVSHRRSCGLW